MYVFNIPVYYILIVYHHRTSEVDQHENSKKNLSVIVHLNILL